MKYLSQYSVRHALAVSITIAIAVLANQFSFSQEGWVILGAFLVTQTTRGTPLRQSLIFFLVINIAIIISALLQMYVKPIIYLDFMIGTVFLGTAYLVYLLQPLSYNNFLSLLYIPIIILISTLLPPSTPTFLHDRILDIAIGSLIGMLCTQLIFPVKLGKEFASGVVPLLQALFEYTHAWANYFGNADNNLRQVNEKKKMIEATLQEHKGIYPVWAYEVGFNPGLRSGFRFFLINLERTVEICFSLDYWGGYIGEKNLPIEFAQAIAVAMQKNQELLQILLSYFSQNKLLDIKSDFTSDMTSLEKALRQTVPDNIEALDISENYLLLTALARDIKDFRGLLLQLVMALPET